MLVLLFEVFGGLAMDRLITAAVMGSYMDLRRRRQHPMDMGASGAGEISTLFQYVT
ncbi:MAG TPA: hypothetical protein VNY08_14205 [Bradyrhizobium sp.]|jgi:hypothetical protein|nr:hypothetical protein [Bradyrhizobium sp.]